MARSDLLEVLCRSTAIEHKHGADPRALLVFAHPDDETIGLGARLENFLSSRLIHVTDGAPRNEQHYRDCGFATREEYRTARQHELNQALRVAGVAKMHHECLEVPDQEASLHLVDLTGKILWLLRQDKPEVLFTHPYEGGHPDHDACAFVVHCAIQQMRNEGYRYPVIVEPAFYHQGPHGIETGCFLPDGNDTPEVLYRLTSDERQHKRELFACFATQQETLKYFPLQHEAFRIAPEYDFAEPPHRGRVFYDQFSWGMTPRHFCELAQAARRELNHVMEVTCHSLY
ncbi:PIG-L deacetylase family protein [Terriglobus albidus]|uniref:PIG-L deacetylase family protein n=1 Tax=Terriglobus albidus TaxID=1592106 RepID=UPI0021DFF6F3|nr:PIG-L family deacetylase [Terriglobus albidus]